jgi:hypothetical protein
MQFFNRVNASTKKTVITFFLSGLLVGIGAGWMITRGYPQEFWFDKTDKFLMPNWHYWLLEETGFLLTTLIACLMAYCKNWIAFAFSDSFARRLLGVTMALASPLLVITIERQSTPGETYFLVTWLVLPVCRASLISFTLWLFTAKFYKRIYGLMVAISVCILPAANAVFFIPANLLNGDSKNFDLVLFALAYSSLASVCGYWLAKANLERRFQQV